MVSTYPSEKWWSEFVSWDDDIHNWMENKSVPPTREWWFEASQNGGYSDCSACPVRFSKIYQ